MLHSFCISPEIHLALRSFSSPFRNFGISKTPGPKPVALGDLCKYCTISKVGFQRSKVRSLSDFVLDQCSPLNDSFAFIISHQFMHIYTGNRSHCAMKYQSHLSSRAIKKGQGSGFNPLVFIMPFPHLPT